LEDGTTIGCPHEALARFMGYNTNKVLSQGYFDGGVANEYIWETNIKAAIASDDVPYNAFRCEEDIPISIELDGKYTITGRPDLVVGEQKEDGTFVPKMGYELKACQTTKSAAAKLYGLKPDPKHICQAALYSRALGCQWSIPYTVNVGGDLGFFDKKTYGRSNLSLGKVEFPIRFNDKDVVEYQDLEGNWVETVISWDGILNFYRLVIEMYEQKEVGATKMASVDAVGEEMPFDFNLYNDFTNMVPVNNGWAEFEKYCKLVNCTPRLIKYSRKKYLVIETEIDTIDGRHYTAEGKNLGSFNALNEARDAMFNKL
jgi:hypothetical protein